MGEKHPPYMLAWSGSYPDVQGLPKVIRRVLQQALTDDREDPAKFLLGMGRLFRLCDIGEPVRRRARQASAAILVQPTGSESCRKLAQAVSLSFSKAFRAVRYRERQEWGEAISPAVAIILARDDLESLWQAVRRGVPVPDSLVDPSALRALRDLRAELDDHIQTVDALHDGTLESCMNHDLAKQPPGPDVEFLNALVASEPVRWWLAVYHLNHNREPRHR